MRSERVQVRMSAERREAVERGAARLGCDVSRYARLLVSIALDGGNGPFLEEPEGRLGSCLSFLVPPSMASAIGRAADASGTTRARWLRAALSADVIPGCGEGAVVVLDADSVANEIRANRTQLYRIGNNVNQIAHAMNVLKGKQWVESAQVEVILNRYASALEKAEADLDAVEDAIRGCLTVLSQAEGDFILVRNRRGDWVAKQRRS